MFARIVEMTCDANQRDKTNEIFRNSILPALKHEGFEGAIQSISKFKPHLTGEPSNKIFDVTVHKPATG